MASKNKFHTSIFSPEQIALMPLLRVARKSGYYMVGGTAISLYIGHRKSIDFDLFHRDFFSPKRVNQMMARSKYSFSKLLVSHDDEVTGLISGVKVTFLAYPFDIEASSDFDGYIKLPDLLTLASMKAYALGRRAKWKDYVDLYFLFHYFSLAEVSKKAKHIFHGGFNEKIFREQLHYFENINYDEIVEYLVTVPPTESEIKDFLKKISLS